ncbi:c-type cytochrome biogenesis protein CcmI [Thalassotalea sp. 1_MG-2023]|uniref:c-type cytochrome biogenesis protein CcmI n=1 Tax=Thalassotalea sp. 1_MG-2023 TaxID=3062680 RepID=UPI0026E3799A|nr:c-type cytochrome biogenesis protein CcmI [Thalassotalea sp. 1_MG-2023]MDO6428697.1 c-type cytochrome biogenesis protein CcmI [Thalassotalea sp. 1_MG-2023]
MVALLFTLIAFILLLLMIVWGHFIRQRNYRNKVDNSFRDETNIRLYKEHKSEIERDFAQGRLDQSSYDYLISELDQSLLQDIEENANEQKQVTETKPITMFWPAIMTVFMLAFSAILYQQTGAFEKLTTMPRQQQSHQSLDVEQQALVQLQKLKQQTEQEPNNSDAWYGLGQALVGAGDFSAALAAFDRVIEIDGEHADLYGAKAQASFYHNEQKITPEVQSYIDKALALDARDPSTNILLGMHAFVNQDYQTAVQHWQLVVSDNRPSVNVQALQQALSEAKSRMVLTGEQASIDVNSQVSLGVKISLSDDIRKQLEQGQDKVVFIYAIPAEGSRMPLAAVKLRASDLPTEVTLSDANAMTPQAKLSDAKAVNVFAIISESGSAGIKPGDFKAEALNVELATNKMISLNINTVVE